MAFAETAALVADLQLKDHLSGAARSATRSISGLDKATSRTQASLGKLAGNLGRALKVGLVVGLGATAAAFGKAVTLAGDFEAQMHTINTVANLTPAELAGVGSALRDISKQTGIALSDITSGYYDLVSAGVKGKLAQEALNDAVKLGIGGLATTGEAINLMTTAINAYGLDVKGAAKATDQFALAVADGTVKAADIAASFADVASVAKAYGVGIDTIATSYAFLTAQGVPAAEVATELQRAIVSIVSPTSDLAVAAKKLGKNFEQDLRKKGIVPTLQEIRDYAEKNHIPLIKLLGRIEAVKFALQTTGDKAAGFNAELERMRKVSGVAASQMAERQQGLNFQLAKLKALASDAGITIGSALLPKLTPLVEKLNVFIQHHAGDISTFGQKLADGFGKFGAALSKVDFGHLFGEITTGAGKALDFAKKIDFGAIGAGLAITGRAAKTIVDAFLALPPDFQKAAVALLAINKVGGGIVTSGIKDILGLALGSLKTITAANVTVIGGNVVGGGLPGAAGAAGGLGLGGIVLGVGAAAAVGAALAIPLANAIRIAAGISPEESERRQNHGQFGPRTGGQHTSVSGAPPVNTYQRTFKRDLDGIRSGLTDVTDETQKLYASSEENRRAANERGKQTITATSEVERAINAASHQTTRDADGIRSSTRAAGVTAKSGGLAAASAIAKKKLTNTTSITVSQQTYFNGRLVNANLSRYNSTVNKGYRPT